jgi:hypothetical protein
MLYGAILLQDMVLDRSARVRRFPKDILKADVAVALL